MTDNSADIETMFEEVLQGTPNKFLESLYEWYETKGFLTDKQLAALKKAYDPDLEAPF